LFKIPVAEEANVRFLSPAVSLSVADAQHLKAAEGWLELGDHVSAFEELEKIQQRHVAVPEVLKLRVRIYMQAQRWEAAFRLAEGLSRVSPDDAEVFVLRSECLRRMPGGDVLQAMELLLDVSKDFPDEPLVPFTLARYNTLLEKLVEATQWLNITFDVAKRIGCLKEWKQRVAAEPDLETLNLKL
jgi:uncharacterized protein HemY